jgi:zinc/manganese transport system substrate-binding protein
MERLEQAAGFKGVESVASAGIAPLSMAEADEAGHDDHDHGHDEDGVDPHAWQNVANAQAYVRNIAAALERADPEGAAVYRANADAYLAELEALDAEIRAAMTAIPAPQRVLATSHDSFGYFAAAYGVTVLAPQGMSTESEASAADVAGLIRQIRADGVRAVFVENITNPRLLEQVSRETGAAIGGVLFSDALSPPGGPAATYVDMMRHNAGTIASALQS